VGVGDREPRASGLGSEDQGEQPVQDQDQDQVQDQDRDRDQDMPRKWGLGSEDQRECVRFLFLRSGTSKMILYWRRRHPSRAKSLRFGRVRDLST